MRSLIRQTENMNHPRTNDDEKRNERNARESTMTRVVATMIHHLLLRKKSVIVRNESGVLKIAAVTTNHHPMNDERRKRRSITEKNTKRKRVKIGIGVTDEKGGTAQDSACSTGYKTRSSCAVVTQQREGISDTEDIKIHKYLLQEHNQPNLTMNSKKGYAAGRQKGGKVDQSRTQDGESKPILREVTEAFSPSYGT
jgi:hypothetical protein